MQTYRLVIGPDGQVKIPEGKPGQVVIVQLEELPDEEAEERLMLGTAKTDEERQIVIERIMENAAELRELLKDELPLTADFLYGEDGLPA